MRNIKPARRSVSPFGTTLEIEQHPLSSFEEAFVAFFPKPESSSRKLKNISDAASIPSVIKKAYDVGSDAVLLNSLCAYLVQFKKELNEKGVTDIIFSAMEQVFNQKTESFLIENQPDEAPQVLCSRDRDNLLARYFVPITSENPGLFSEFMTRWIQTENMDRLLHFFDFAIGSKNPTFEHYLLFSQPVLQRLLTNKSNLRTLFQKVTPLTSKFSNPAWEMNVRLALEI